MIHQYFGPSRLRSSDQGIVMGVRPEGTSIGGESFREGRDPDRVEGGRDHGGPGGPWTSRRLW